MGTGRGKRLAIRLAACAVIGAVVTIVIAWLLWLTPNRSLRPATEITGPVQWPVSVPTDWPAPAKRFRLQTVGLTIDSCHANTRGPDGKLASFAGYKRVQSGLPFRALWVGDLRFIDWSSKAPAMASNNGLRIPQRVMDAFGFEADPEALPIRPLGGFALDTAFYAAIALTLWSAPGAIRGHRRRARGRCPACGYHLRGTTSAVCPECGASPKGGRDGVAEGTEEVPSASAPAP
jgi:hypothetical protein